MIRVTLVALLTLTLCTVVHAQDDLAAQEAALRARVEASATDLSARCELAYVLVREERFEDARALLAPTLDALPAPTGSERARRGACLYNLGRAEEGLAHTDAAITRYRASLALRPNDSVRARLDALLAQRSSTPVTPVTPRVAAPAPTILSAELATLCGIDGEHRPEIRQTLAVTTDTATRALVLDDRSEWRVALVGDAHCALSDPLYDGSIAAAWNDASTVTASVTGEGARARIAVRARLVHDTYGTAEDFVEERAIVVWPASDGSLRTFTLPIAASRATDPGFELALSFDAQGRSVLATRSGAPPPEVVAMLGTHPLPMRDVPELFSGEVIPASLARALRGRLFERTRIVERVDDPAMSARLVFTETRGNETEGLYYPVLRVGDRWMVAAPMTQYYPASNAAHTGGDTVTAHLSIRPVLSGGAPALIVEWERSRADFCEDVYDEEYTVTATSVYWPDGTHARGWTIPTSFSANYDHPFRLSVTLDQGNVTVAVIEGAAPPGVRAALGTHPIVDIHPRCSVLGGEESEVRAPTP